MLKRLTLRNFVHFEDEQTFEFDKGSYFFIGENKSGKTCSFEAIRRCMSTSKNLFISTTHDRAKSSCVICEYASSHTDNGQLKTIYSCIVSVPAVERSDVIVVKLVIEKSEENKVYVDLLKKNKHGYAVNRMFPLNYTKHRMSIQTLLKNGISIDNLESFITDCIVKTEFYRSFVSQTVNMDYDPTTECEQYLKTTVDMDVVMTEPMRSVGAVQWTNSPKFDDLPRLDEGCDRLLHLMRENSEILFWYLDNPNILEAERKRVDELFDILTEGSQLRFKKRDRIIQVIDNGSIVSLEKAPEGLLEAKICAILLSIHQFKTICLEEPGKGMHVQMIERLRDLVLKDIEDKTIILISHNPAFLISWNIEKIFFFRRQQVTASEPKFTAIQGKEILPSREHKTRRIMVDHGLSTIFFASRVLLVEGLSEELFISAMKSILLHDRHLTDVVIESVDPTLKPETLHRFLCSLHILKLGGERNKLRFERICSRLHLERYFILDYDAIEDKGTENFFVGFKLESLESDFRRDGVIVLENSRIFVWAKPDPDSKNPNQKGGTIEEAMIKLVNIPEEEELKSLFIDNNVVLNWDYRNDVKRKLFKDKNLTDENIEAVVCGVIQACLKHKDSDVFRLLKFLIRGAALLTGNVGSTNIYTRRQT